MRVDISSSVAKHCDSPNGASHVLVMRPMTFLDKAAMYGLVNEQNGAGLGVWFIGQIDHYEVDGNERPIDSWYAMPHEVMDDSWAAFTESIDLGEADADSSA